MVRSRYGALPARVRRSLEELPAFAKHFSTYRTNTFDPEAAPVGAAARVSRTQSVVAADGSTVVAF